MAENLQAVYRDCIYNLDSVHPNTIPNIHFEFNGTTWVCSRALHEPQIFASVSPIPISDSALIFQVVGQISQLKPITTRDGQTSFWVESRPDVASRTLWSRIPDRLHAIVAESSQATVNFTRLYDIDDSGVMLLKIMWARNVGIPGFIPFSVILTMIAA
jgi:hypothetical protein